MNDLESRVAERLHARESAAPPPSLHLAVAVGAAVERRRHRRRIWASVTVALVAAVAATIVFVPVVLLGNGQPKPPDPATSSSNRPSERVSPPTSVAARTSHAALPERLARLFPGVDALVVDRRLADDSDFRGLSVSDDGIVAGINQSHDKDFSDRWDRAVLLDLEVRRYSTYADVNPDLLRAGSSPAADGSTLSWSIGQPDRCRDLASGRERAAWDGGNPRPRAPGLEPRHGTRTVATPPPRSWSRTAVHPASRWQPRANSSPSAGHWVYLRDERGDYFRVSADTGRRETVPRPPNVPADASRTEDTFGVAAHGDVVAWQLDGRLAVCVLPGDHLRRTLGPGRQRRQRDLFVGQRRGSASSRTAHRASTATRRRARESSTTRRHTSSSPCPARH